MSGKHVDRSLRPEPPPPNPRLLGRGNGAPVPPSHAIEARRRLLALVGEESFDVLEAALLIAAEEYPSLDPAREMRRVDAIPLPDHNDVKLESGGYHLMLIGLKKPLEVGDTVPVRLNFEHAKPVSTELTVQTRATAAHEHMGHH